MRALLILAFAIAAQAQTWVDPDRSAPAGTEYHTFFSNTIGGQISYLIYLPPDHQTAAMKRYPVVYWLHGLGGNQRGGATFVAHLDAAIKTGKAPPVIAVLVNGLRDSRYCDSFDGQRPVETVIVKDLIPHVDMTYRTVARGAARAIEGLSMGGFGAAHLAFSFPSCSARSRSWPARCWMPTAPLRRCTQISTKRTSAAAAPTFRLTAPGV